MYIGTMAAVQIIGIIYLDIILRNQGHTSKATFLALWITGHNLQHTFLKGVVST